MKNFQVPVLGFLLNHCCYSCCLSLGMREEKSDFSKTPSLAWPGKNNEAVEVFLFFFFCRMPSPLNLGKLQEMVRDREA